MASKNFVLDTNVLIENPKCIQALRNGQDNNIHIPYTVLTELDKLKRDPRLGHDCCFTSFIFNSSGCFTHA